MAITVITPALGNFVGAGYAFRFQSDVVGPFPSTCQWQAFVFDLPTTGTILIQNSALNVQHVWAGNWSIAGPQRDSIFTAPRGAAFGADCGIHIALVDTSDGSAIDGPTQFITYAWDPVGNLGALINTVIASGTLSSSQSQQLTDIHAAVAANTYTTTTTHVGLTGAGFVATAHDTRALRVTIITFPANAITDPGVPEYFFNVGFITVNDANGFVRSARLVFEFQLYELPASATGFGYTLRGGTVINVEELAPGS